MPPRTLASLAHALNVAPDLDAALVALGESLADLDRSAHVALLRYDGRHEMLRERLTPSGGRVTRSHVGTTFDHLPGPIRTAVSNGAQLVELGDRSEEYARLFGLRPMTDGGLLALRGILFDGSLAAVLALYEPKKFFGAKTADRFAPAIALFDLAFARFHERDARQDAVRTLEDVTQRVHGDYIKKLGEMEGQLSHMRDQAERASSGPSRVVAAERSVAEATEEARRAGRLASELEQQLMAAIGQIEQDHVELHRRSETLRQKTRTLYLIERMLTLYDSSTDDARALAEGLLSLAGEDMQAQRCSLMLVAPDRETLYLAAARGLSPEVLEGVRTRIGEGVAGRVARSREPLLVQDVADAKHHPLLEDQYFTTGSFISFPLVLHGTLFGVVNLTNRARHGIYGEEDVERVRLLALILSLMVAHARLAERMFETFSVR